MAWNAPTRIIMIPAKTSQPTHPVRAWGWSGPRCDL